MMMTISIMREAIEMSIDLSDNMDTDTQIEDGTWRSVTIEPLFMINTDITTATSIVTDTILKVSSTDMTDTTAIVTV